MGERRIQLAGEALEAGYHACALFQSLEEESAVLMPYIQEGLAAGEKAIHIVDPDCREDHLRRLAAAGADLGAVVRLQLDVLRWDETHLCDGAFDPDLTLQRIEGRLADCYTHGYRHVRLIGYMEWAVQPLPGVARFLEYEARLNELIARHQQPIVCVYDTNRFDVRALLEVMRAHPLVVLGGVLRRNPFFVPPDEYLRRLERRSMAA